MRFQEHSEGVIGRGAEFLESAGLPGFRGAFTGIRLGLPRESLSLVLDPAVLIRILDPDRDADRDSGLAIGD